jgi:hypothetical protein
VPRLRRSESIILYFSVAQQHKSALGRLSVEVSRSHTPNGRTSLNRRSALHRGHYPHNTQQTQETNTHALSGVRIHDPSNRVALELRLRLSYTSTPPIFLQDVEWENFAFFGYDSVKSGIWGPTFWNYLQLAWSVQKIQTRRQKPQVSEEQTLVPPTSVQNAVPRPQSRPRHGQLVIWLP